MKLEAASIHIPGSLVELLADLGTGENGFGGTPVATGELTFGGSGQVPAVVIAEENRIDELMQFLAIAYDNQSWVRAAECDLYAYGVNINGGPYRRIAVPVIPWTANQCPDRFRDLFGRVVVPGCFAPLTEINYELLGL